VSRREPAANLDSAKSLLKQFEAKQPADTAPPAKRAKVAKITVTSKADADENVEGR